MKIEDWKVLPKEAIEKLKDYVDVHAPGNEVEVVADPKVEGTFALQVKRMDKGCSHPTEFHLLWYCGGYDEVEYTMWPPHSGDTKLFI
jgi:hypothetical protein